MSFRESQEKEQFTVVLHFTQKAPWWGDVIERLIDLPIPVPAVKEQPLMAWRIGTREEASIFRAELAAKVESEVSEDEKVKAERMFKSQSRCL
jgi:hypothetical protein